MEIAKMWVCTSPLKEGNRLYGDMPTLILILGFFSGLWITEVRAGPIGGGAEVPDMCPTIYRHIPRDSRDLIPVPRSEGFSILCRVNTSTSLCEWILIATRDRSYYFNRDLKNHIILHPMGLIVTHMNKDLEGEYHVLSGLNRTCTGRVLMTAVGPLFIYRIFLLIPGIMFLCGMGLLWDCLIKARNQLAISEEEQITSDRIQHVISPSDLSSSL